MVKTNHRMPVARASQPWLTASAAYSAELLDRFLGKLGQPTEALPAWVREKLGKQAAIGTSFRGVGVGLIAVQKRLPSEA